MTDGPCRASGPRRDGCEVRGGAGLFFNAERQRGGEAEGAGLVFDRIDRMDRILRGAGRPKSSAPLRLCLSALKFR